MFPLNISLKSKIWRKDNLDACLSCRGVLCVMIKILIISFVTTLAHAPIKTLQLHSFPHTSLKPFELGHRNIKKTMPYCGKKDCETSARWRHQPWSCYYSSKRRQTGEVGLRERVNSRSAVLWKTFRPSVSPSRLRVVSTESRASFDSLSFYVQPLCNKNEQMGLLVFVHLLLSP